MSVISILGAGVAGLCVANELLSRGASIRVFDKQPQPGPHACSWWAGGCWLLSVNVKALKSR
ncbi:FAD-dependent oxidoreductase [Nitrincola sp. A-D6]|uniref:FAD-dependent oxidoreductase n=1 Tax=Nitrincola sp. A-D6 TaxID=1545442 RepID=UPI00190FAFB4